MTMETKPQTSAPREDGFALILAILALMLLTFLGLTLATTTSTELQIATNYRWSLQAYYNAEAGIEAGKVILQGVPGDWNTVLPTWRGPWSGSPPAVATIGSGAPAGTRNWEGSDCDTRNGTGYGAVLLGKENVTQYQGQRVNGAFTLWVRRDVASVAGSAALQDETTPTNLPANNFAVLVSEGVAPQAVNVGGTALQAARAVRVLQVKLQYGQTTRGCQSAEGQAGGTAAGSNFGACAPLDTGSITGALGGAGAGSLADLGAK